MQQTSYLISGSLVINTYDKNVLYWQIKSFFVLQTFWTPAIHAFVITLEHSYRALKSIFNGQWTSGFLSHILLNLSYLKNGIVIVGVTLPRYFNIWLPLLRWSWSLNNVLLIFAKKISLNRRWQFFQPASTWCYFSNKSSIQSVVSYRIKNFLLKWETNLPSSSLYYPSQLSNLRWMPNSVSKGFDPAMKTGSSRRFKRYPTTYRWVLSQLPFTEDKLGKG